MGGFRHARGGTNFCLLNDVMSGGCGQQRSGVKRFVFGELEATFLYCGFVAFSWLGAVPKGIVPAFSVHANGVGIGEVPC